MEVVFISEEYSDTEKQILVDFFQEIYLQAQTKFPPLLNKLDCMIVCASFSKEVNKLYNRLGITTNPPSKDCFMKTVTHGIGNFDQYCAVLIDATVLKHLFNNEVNFLGFSTIHELVHVIDAFKMYDLGIASRNDLLNATALDLDQAICNSLFSEYNANFIAGEIIRLSPRLVKLNFDALTELCEEVTLYPNQISLISSCLNHLGRVLGFSSFIDIGQHQEFVSIISSLLRIPINELFEHLESTRKNYSISDFYNLYAFMKTTWVPINRYL